MLAVLPEAAGLFAVFTAQLLDGGVESALGHRLDGRKALQNFSGFVAVHVFDGAQQRGGDAQTSKLESSASGV